jgi:hypothetical protein
MQIFLRKNLLKENIPKAKALKRNNNIKIDGKSIPIKKSNDLIFSNCGVY